MEKLVNKIWIKTIIIILLMGLIFGLFFYLKGNKKSERHFAILPHFMLDNDKVNQFYNLINEKYYSEEKPDTIILISPNHFHSETNEVKTVCINSPVKYKSELGNLSSELYKLGVKCDEEKNIFYSRGNGVQTDEHGIGEHFKWINKYFPNAKIIPVISPCFQLLAVKDVSSIIDNLNGNILVLASVDFAHYQTEEQTLQHDEKSIETLKSMSLMESDFIEFIDADCPACLYLIQYLANKQGQSPELRWRDSSSTILGQDMGENNTSRIFMWYE